MGNHIIRVKTIEMVTHDVLKIVTDKSAKFNFEPGQATKIAINKSGWYNEERPFTFTNLPASDSLEFTIKTYPEHGGVTKQLLELRPQDELILHGVFGAIQYKGEGVFIAGGAGITPFISIFRDLKAKHEIGNNMLLFANKTKGDIILEKEFETLLGDAFVNILSDEEIEGYEHGRISGSFIKSYVKDFNQQFYICGPKAMIASVEEDLFRLGVREDQITKEIF